MGYATATKETITIRALFGQWKSLGFGLLWSLNIIILFSSKLAARDMPRIVDFFNSTLATGIVVTCAALFAYTELIRKGKPLNKPITPTDDGNLALHRTLATISGVMLAMCIVCIGIQTQYTPSHTLRYALGFATGVATAFGYYAWLSILATRGWENVRLELLGSYLLGAILFCLSYVIPTIPLVALMATLALVVAYMGRTLPIERSQASASPKPQTARRLSSRDIRAVVLSMLILSFIYGISGPMFLQSTEPLPFLENPENNQVLTVCLSVGIIFLQAKYRCERANPLMLIHICYLIDVTSAFLLPFAPDWYVSVFNVIVLTIFRISALLLLGLCVATQNARLRRRAMPIMISCVWIGLSLGIGLGHALYLNASDSADTSMSIILTIVYVVFAFTSIYTLAKNGSNAPAPAPEPTPAADKRDSHEIISQRYNLNPREEEIMALLIRGRTAKYIAEDLTLSINTVRSYTKSLYAKMNVHSKQELIDLAEAISNE